jgi:hypothetical protein
MRADILAGAVFPDYELTDQTGKHRKLSDLQGPDPVRRRRRSLDLFIRSGAKSSKGSGHRRVHGP